MINCQCCGVLFSPLTGKRKGGKESKYCSKKCNALAYRRRIFGEVKIETKECLHCKKLFKNDKFHPNVKTCSKKCSNAIYKKENKEKLIKKSILWNKENKDLLKIYQINYYKKHKEKVLIKKRARLTAKITYSQWESLCKNTYYLCVQCLEKFDVKDLTIDHIIPVSLGGTNEIKNLQPMCMPCNRLKGNRWIGRIPRDIYLNMVNKNEINS